MCVIGQGEYAILLKGGLVKLKNGDVYHLSDCTLEAGGRLALSIGQVSSTKPPRSKPPKKVIKGEVLFSDSEEVHFLEEGLREPVVVLKEIRQEIQQPPPLPPPAEIPYSPFVVMGGILMFVLKKVAGLDRVLKAGTCEMRHQEAIFRIAKLEGKVLRKQIVDGAKGVKGAKEKWDSRKAKEEDSSIDS